jgi:hypothetical protein
MKRGFFDANAHVPQPAGCGRIWQKILRKNAVKIEDRVTVQANFFCVVHKERNRVLVVDDHLRFEAVPTCGFLPRFDEALCIQQGVGVSLEAA